MNPMNPKVNEDFYTEVRAGVHKQARNPSAFLARLQAMNGGEKQLQGSQNSEGQVDPVAEAAMPNQDVEMLANEPSDFAVSAQAREEEKLGVLDILEWATSPLMAAGDAIVAPIAEGTTGVMDTLSAMGRAAADRLHPELGSEHPDYAGQVIERYLPDTPEVMKPVLSTGISIATDPASYLGFTGFKAFQKGMEIKALQAKGHLPKTNKGFLEEGVAKLASLSGYDEANLTRIGQVAARVDRGDKDAITELREVMSDKRLLRAVDDEELKAIQLKLRDYEEAFGDVSAPYAVYDKATLRQVAKDMGLESDEVGKAININLAKLNTPEDVDSFLQELGGHFKEMMEGSRNKRKMKEMYEGAAMNSLGDLLGRKPTHFSPEQAIAIRQFLVATGTKAQQMIKIAAKSNRKIDQLAAMKAFQLNAMVMQKAVGVSSEYGRGLRTFREVVGSNRERFNQVNMMMKEMDGSDQTTREFMRFLKNAGVEDMDAHEFQRIAGKGFNAFSMKGYDALYETYVNAILSGPLTHATNIASNASMLFMRPTDKYLRSVSAAARGDFSESVNQFKQANASLSGMAGGMSDVFRIALRRVNKEDVNYPERLERMHELSKQKIKPAITAENFSATGMMGHVVDFAGAIIRLPGNALLKEDKAFKLINYRMGVNEEAAKMAHSLSTNNDDAKAIYRAVRANPDEQMTDSAINLAEYYTFTNKLGEAGQRWEKATRVPGVNLIVPFFRTPTNILKMGTRNSFIGNMRYDVPELLSANGAKRDAALAKVAMGTLAPVTALMMLGDNLTGKVDMSTANGRFRAEYEAPPYSIRVGDKWISYEKIEPLRSVLGLMANYKDSLNGLDDQDDNFVDDSLQLGLALARPFVNTIADNAMLDVFGHMHYMIDGVQSGNAEYAGRQVSRMFAAMATPNFIAQFTNLELDGKLRMSDNIIDDMNKRVWWRSNDLPIRPNAFGEEQYYPSNMVMSLVNPFLQRPDKQDPIADKMLDLGVAIPDISPKTITLNKIPINLDVHQRSRMGVLIGRGVKKGNSEGFPELPPMRSVIRDVTSQPFFSHLTEEEQKNRIEALYRVRKKHVVNLMRLSDPKIEQAYREGQEALFQDRMRAQQGGTQ